MPGSSLYDEVPFDLTGEFRVEWHGDGFYVVGHGSMSPVDSEEEGAEVIKMLKSGGRT